MEFTSKHYFLGGRGGCSALGGLWLSARNFRTVTLTAITVVASGERPVQHGGQRTESLAADD